MNCDRCQQQLCEAREDPQVEQHLAACPVCRAFCDAWMGVNAELSGHFAPAALPGDFKANLLSKLPARSVQPTRAELEREYEEAIAALNRTFWLPQAIRLARLLAAAAASILAGILLGSFVQNAPVATVVQVLGCVVAVAVLVHGARRVWSPALRGLPWWRLLLNLSGRR